MLRTIVLAAAGVAVAVAANAADFKPAIVYDLGGKFDKSFNEAAYTGAEKFREETGIDYRDFEIQNDAQREQAMRRFAQQGYSPIIAVGFTQAAAVEKIAEQYPDTQFGIIDMVVEKPNVRSVLFKEHEGSYLVGVLAALASETGKVGFVGGMDVPLIRKFACGYVGGVKSVVADGEVFQTMTGDTGAAWTDPVKGAELARSQMDRGADVIYHAAGGTGIGVLNAAAEAGHLGIGVDSNQNGLFPGHVLTSMLKRVDMAMYTSFMDAMNDEFTPGVQVLGLAEGGVGYALDENNAALITDEMKTLVDAAAEKIISGEVVVHDYMTDSACPY